MADSYIDWTDKVWNPITGCTKTSAGCKNCYAERFTKELQDKGEQKYKDGFKIVKCHPECLREPYKWKKPEKVFVNSMSDLFHKDVPLDFIKQVFRVINDNDQLVFQILTKRAERLLECDPLLKWTNNIWMGVSVENEAVKYRIDLLRECHAKLKFLSIEPLIGSLGELNLNGIDWVIVGGENAPEARPMKEEWILDIQRQCNEQNVLFFFKQWGGRTGHGSCLLNGKEYREIPTYEPAFFGV